MAGTLLELLQDDFSAGAWPRVAAEKIPENGFADSSNMLLNEQGLPYCRGGSVYKSNAGYAAGARMIWDGILAPGQRTVWARANGAGYSLCTLSGDDATPFDVGGGTVFLGSPGKPVVHQGMLVIPRTDLIGQPLIYAGSRGGSAVAIGNVGVTNGSTQVSGAALDTKYTVGQFFSVDNVTWYAIQSLVPTALTLATPFRGATNAAIAGLRADYINPPAPFRQAPYYMSVGGRLLALIRDTVYESAINDPFSWTTSNNVQLPAGVDLLGGEPMGTSALLFTTAGIWLLSNLHLNLTDAAGNTQQRLEQVNADLMLLGSRGVVSYGTKLIAPMVDDVYLLDSISTPTPISGGYLEQYRSWVKAGCVPGFATISNGHYILPILDPDYTVRTTLVCRLTANMRQRGRYAWTQIGGDGATMTGYAQRRSSSGAAGALLGAHAWTARIYDLRFFDAGQDVYSTPPVSTDANGTSPTGVLLTRAYRISDGIKRFFKRVRLFYDLTDPAPSTGNPIVGLSVTDMHGQSWVALSESAPETSLSSGGEAPPASKTWRVNRRLMGIRLRFEVTGARGRFLIRSIKASARQSGRS